MAIKKKTNLALYACQRFTKNRPLVSHFKVYIARPRCMDVRDSRKTGRLARHAVWRLKGRQQNGIPRCMHVKGSRKTGRLASHAVWRSKGHQEKTDLGLYAC